MSIPTNWPIPERPGVPIWPERDGNIWEFLKYKLAAIQENCSSASFNVSI